MRTPGLHLLRDLLLQAPELALARHELQRAPQALDDVPLLERQLQVGPRRRGQGRREVRELEGVPDVHALREIPAGPSSEGARDRGAAPHCMCSR